MLGARAMREPSRVPFFERCPVCADGRSALVVAFAELIYVQCQGCRLIYKREQVPRLGVGYEDEYFKFNRAKYLERWEHRVAKCMRQLRDCLQVTPGAKDVVDVGCSAGYVLEAAKRLGLSPVGVDLSKFAVGLCQERGYRALEGELARLPLPDASVDVVTLKHTLEHVTSPLDGLRELFRVLRPGGAALIVVPDAAYWKLSVMPRRGRSFRPELRGWQHHVYFFQQNLDDALARAGFVVRHRHKAVWRAGARWPVLEALRYGAFLAIGGLWRVTRLRRELYVVAQKPAG